MSWLQSTFGACGSTSPVGQSEEIVSSASGVSFRDNSTAPGSPVAPASASAHVPINTVLLVRSRARPTEAALLILRCVACCRPNLVAIVPLCMNIRVRLVLSSDDDPNFDNNVGNESDNLDNFDVTPNNNSDSSMNNRIYNESSRPLRFRSKSLIIEELPPERVSTPSFPISPQGSVTDRKSTSTTVSAESAPHITLVLNDPGEIGGDGEEHRIDPRVKAFTQAFIALKETARRHRYNFPSKHCNHDWLWSYGAQRLPASVQSAQPEILHRKSKSTASLVYGNVHLRNIVGGNWDAMQTQLRTNEADYCQEVPLRLCAITLNCGGQMPPKQGQCRLADLFASQQYEDRVWQDAPLFAADLVLVSLQETCPLMLAVDVTDRATAQRHTKWAAAISDAVAEELGKYVCVADARLVGLQLLVFAKAALAGDIGQVYSGILRCGPLGMGNKGAVAASFTLFATSFCFVNAHITAGTKLSNITDRAHDFRQVVTALRLDSLHRAGAGSEAQAPPGASTTSLRHQASDTDDRTITPSAMPDNVLSSESRNIFEHDVVVCGLDGNWRLWKDLDRAELLGREEVFAAFGDDGDPDRLVAEHDELSLQRARGSLFAAFEESPVCFAPTYKFKGRGLFSNSNGQDSTQDFNDVSIATSLRRSYTTSRTGETLRCNSETSQDAYVSSRVPAFTDRVLWRTRPNIEVVPQVYECINSVDFSDHRPVRLGLQVVARAIHWDKLRRMCTQQQLPSGHIGLSSMRKDSIEDVTIEAGGEYWLKSPAGTSPGMCPIH